MDWRAVAFKGDWTTANSSLDGRAIATDGFWATGGKLFLKTLSVIESSVPVFVKTLNFFRSLLSTGISVVVLNNIKSLFRAIIITETTLAILNGARIFFKNLLAAARGLDWRAIAFSGDLTSANSSLDGRAIATHGFWNSATRLIAVTMNRAIVRHNPLSAIKVISAVVLNKAFSFFRNLSVIVLAYAGFGVTNIYARLLSIVSVVKILLTLRVTIVVKTMMPPGGPEGGGGGGRSLIIIKIGYEGKNYESKFVLRKFPNIIVAADYLSGVFMSAKTTLVKAFLKDHKEV